MAFEMRRHGDDSADRDDAGATDAGDEQVVRAGPCMRCRPRQLGDERRETRRASPRERARALLQRAADDADKARAKALSAGIVLVATRLVDLALATERRLGRQDGDAVRLHRAVAAAFADLSVDEEPPRRIDELAFLAPAALLGSAGLLVDENGHALHLAQAPLHDVELAAVVERGSLRKAIVDGVVLG